MRETSKVESDTNITIYDKDGKLIYTSLFDVDKFLKLDKQS